MASRASSDDVLVIGLGRFGGAAALELRRLGHRVTAMEKDGLLAERYLGSLSHVIHADGSDPAACRDAKVHRFSIAIVAIGSSIEGSVCQPRGRRRPQYLGQGHVA